MAVANDPHEASQYTHLAIQVVEVLLALKTIEWPVPCAAPDVKSYLRQRREDVKEQQVLRALDLTNTTDEQRTTG